MSQFCIKGNQSVPWKRHDVKIYKDDWFTIARVSSDAQWFIDWLEIMLKENPPKEIKNVTTSQE